MSSPSAKTLRTRLGIDDAEAWALKEVLKKAAYGDHDDVDQALEDADVLLGGHGIEPIRGNYQVDRYYYDIVALYVNMGDTYDETILYETDTGNFKATSWGDWVEAHTKEYDIQ